MSSLRAWGGPGGGRAGSLAAWGNEPSQRLILCQICSEETVLGSMGMNELGGFTQQFKPPRRGGNAGVCRALGVEERKP